MVKAKVISPENGWVEFDMSQVKIITPVDSHSMRVIFNGGKSWLIDTIINE